MSFAASAPRRPVGRPRARRSPLVTTLVILAFAMVQVVVHMVYFLHMNPKSEGGWNLFALIFTAVLLVIVLSGTLWVMHNMNTHMMPDTHDMHHAQEAAQSLP